MSELDQRGLLDGRQNPGRSETTVSPSATTPAPTVTLVNLECDDSASRMITVYLGVPEIENFSVEKPVEFGLNIGIIPAIAIVEWGSGGHQHSAEIDFGVGCAASFACSYLRVKGRLDPRINFGISPGPPFIPIRLPATTGYGTRPGFLRGPTRTIRTDKDIASGGTSGLLPIPAFARTGTLVQNDLTDTAPVANHHVTFWDALGVQFAEWYGTVLELNHMPIPNGAVQWTVTNGDSTASFFSIVWELAF